MTNRSHVTQVDLPGQVYVADGPFDHTGMYCMHFAFRRDLADLTVAVPRTPLDDTATWRALRRRWAFFAEVLHHHHRVEDEHYWPALTEAVAGAGDDADRSLLAAMEAEHASLASALTSCQQGFELVAARGATDDREALTQALRGLRLGLEEHLAHEETGALPLVQRVMEPAAYAEVERAVATAYPVRLVPQLVPWVLYGLPGEALPLVLDTLGGPVRLLHALTRRGFERRQRRTFRHLRLGV